MESNDFVLQLLESVAEVLGVLLTVGQRNALKHIKLDVQVNFSIRESFELEFLLDYDAILAFLEH